MKLTRSFFASTVASTVLAAALIPFAATAHADHHGKRGNMPEYMEERMEERRQAVYEQAGISEEKQAELNAAREAHYGAMRKLREEHYARMQEILTDEERAALKAAMRDMHKEYRDTRGYHDGRGMGPQATE